MFSLTPFLRTHFSSPLLASRARGLRYEESVKAYSLIIDSAKEGKLNEYYNVETEALEHFRFKQLFIRRTKKGFHKFHSETAYQEN
jgi:hypothetical protein